MEEQTRKQFEKFVGDKMYPKINIDMLAEENRKKLKDKIFNDMVTKYNYLIKNPIHKRATLFSIMPEHLMSEGQKEAKQYIGENTLERVIKDFDRAYGGLDNKVYEEAKDEFVNYIIQQTFDASDISGLKDGGRIDFINKQYIPFDYSTYLQRKNFI